MGRLIVGIAFGAIGNIALTGCQALPPAIIGVENPARPVAAVAEANTIPMFIATNRVPSKLLGEFYSGERAGELSFASVVVSVPPIHRTGLIEQAKALPPDPKRHFMAIQPVRYADDAAFIGAVNAAADRLPPDKRDILIFVHGYNTRMTDAVLRLGQFVNDSGFEGIPVLFSWPSRGQSLQYVYDLNSALSSRDALEETAYILLQTRSQGAHLLAHSMGNILAMESMRQVQHKTGLNRSGRLSTVILASPDIDIDLFRSQIAEFPEDRLTKFYALVSQEDRPLDLSRRIAGGINRAGNSDPRELADTGITVIDLTEINDKTSSSHSFFADSPEVVKTIGLHLSEGGELSTRSQFGDSLPRVLVIQ